MPSSASISCFSASAPSKIVGISTKAVLSTDIGFDQLNSPDSFLRPRTATNWDQFLRNQRMGLMLTFPMIAALLRNDTPRIR